MFIIAIIVSLFVSLALSATDILVSNISSDELNNMGVEKKA